MARIKTYLETFTFPDISYQSYPVYAITESEKIINLKSIMYPSMKSQRKYTRKKQLATRSTQAKIFDSLINIGYWDPLPVIREFPVVIQNSSRLPNQSGTFYYLDYYFPTLDLAVELDSDFHSISSDKIRDEYLSAVCNIETFRIRNLDKEVVQKGRFKELIKKIRQMTPLTEPRVFAFGSELYLKGLK